ncbi:hypothetical protein D9758_018181 [Tetrapyrgos nigripes]|uniref:Cytochrome P450 n=1 Tax=Tetrapyrgos nigripes TaxID=182062 RepID=A0A8H5EVV3_9AGAR|nr:hypothetical protein D9758_018181 [Tetrapyrgos nigripes]
MRKRYRLSSALEDFPKDNSTTVAGTPMPPPVVFLILKDEDHTSRRRLWTRGMSSQALKEYEGFIGNRANILIEKLEAMAGAGSSVDIAEWISYFTFGFDFEFLRNAGDKDGLLGAMRRFAIAVQVVCHIPWVATYANKIPMFGRDMQILRAFGVGAATRRVKVGASSKDLWYHLTDEAGFEKSKPSIASVVADGTLAIVAGADTTVSALSSLFYFLLSDPTCYKRLQQEVDAVYPPGSDPLDVSKHAELVFMNGCLNEALRLQPPVPTNGPRQVPVDSGGRMISGHFSLPELRFSSHPTLYTEIPVISLPYQTSSCLTGGLTRQSHQMREHSYRSLMVLPIVWARFLLDKRC